MNIYNRIQNEQKRNTSYFEGLTLLWILNSKEVNIVELFWLPIKFILVFIHYTMENFATARAKATDKRKFLWSNCYVGAPIKKRCENGKCALSDPSMYNINLKRRFNFTHLVYIIAKTILPDKQRVLRTGTVAINIRKEAVVCFRS